ncbi:calcium-binding protein [Arenibaculum pallidiluteum]|uniref:calcium-binding protein n=1 Tax=Arenibaculum pallidiluteum TaxID=2812559 RepID=UPI001A96C1A6|nr:calcium-binding protein [Arenibaculum pallidiluteum]
MDINGSNRSETLAGTSGADTIRGLRGDDVLSGGGGNDTLLGGEDGDILDGGIGSDILDGGSILDQGVDTADYRSIKSNGVTVDLVKGTANDGTGTDTLIEIENVQGTNLTDTITGDGENNFLIGNGGVDFLNGGGGGDIIMGGINKDFINGGSGADKIAGGEGGDNLTGGSGADTFQFSFLKDVGVGASGRDVITDLEKGLDKIDVSVLDANAALSGNQAFSFIGTKGFSDEGQVRAIAQNNGQLIQFNTTGDGAAEFEIFVETPLSISGSDFFL